MIEKLIITSEKINHAGQQQPSGFQDANLIILRYISTLSAKKVVNRTL